MTSFSPFSPNPHSEGFHSALRYLFPAKKENKNPIVNLLIYTVKPKSIQDVKHLPLAQAPGFSDRSHWYLPLPCHSRPVRVSPEVQHPRGAKILPAVYARTMVQSQAEIPYQVTSSQPASRQGSWPRTHWSHKNTKQVHSLNIIIL